MRYMIWNNKGGVGKTFLTYCMAVEYAIANPGRKVIVADLCPQANISEMLLGGNGKGEENLESLKENGRTIASYILKRYDGSRFGRIGNELSYFVKVNEFNDQMPGNLHLVPGDNDLDSCNNLIDYLSLAPEKRAWSKSRIYVKDLLESFMQDHPDADVFIDCNPSFASYTHLGLFASDRLIVPCTADSASLRGIQNLFRLIYGISTDSRLADEVFGTFHEKTREAGIQLPKVHSFVLNKNRVQNKQKTIAFNAHVNRIREVVKNFNDRSQEIFSPTQGHPDVYNIKDANNLALVMNYHGMPPSKMTHKKYDVYGDKTQVNEEQITAFMRDLETFVGIL